MKFDLKKLKGWLDDGHAVLGHPLARLAFPLVLGLLPKFGQITDEEMAELKKHAEDYDAMAAEARRRAGQV